ncbi:uncharacterized protein MELLADRAFT_103263 [Melampsora larici-populina 98AG31]|uniref:Uncharacterized protein n=1 Tax=Melampsora larici-populina (strain 98AG31 / pathotype 3-4-7) TaxID=747676 RepID=F4R9U1_MELLP|nr:uncharacterized protein MELLADRAFT_103263 [Melampsora larici-populina 98AG31]EGG10582.1 hypothetical protein MELLADRAFT_103263 [Melampsora larici-populina 98AG31]
MEPPYLPIGFQSGLVLGEKVSLASTYRFSLGHFSSEVFTTSNGLGMTPITVIETSPGQLEGNSCYYVYGRILARRYPMGPGFHADRTIPMTSRPGSQFQAASQDYVLVTSIGRVLECYFSDQRMRWVVKERMGELGVGTFEVGSILSFDGHLIGYAAGSDKWTINAIAGPDH